MDCSVILTMFLLTTSAVSDLANLPSNSGGTRAIIDQIYEDCNAAASVLPASYTGADLGRATKWAAKTILMKAQLWDKKWADAKATAEDIINNSGIVLFDDFSYNFDEQHENMGERIFEGQVSAAANANEYNNHSAHFNPEDYPTEFGGAGWELVECLHCPTIHPELVAVVPLFRKGEVWDGEARDGGNLMIEGATSFTATGASDLPKFPESSPTTTACTTASSSSRT